MVGSFVVTNITPGSILTFLLLLRNVKVSGQDIGPSRAQSYDSTNLKCQIGITQQSNDPLSYVDFEYWYAIGTTSTSDINQIQMFNLEQLLYNNVEDDMVWCWEEIGNTNVVAASTSSNYSGNRKRDLSKSLKSKRRTAAIIQNRTITNQQVRRIDSRSLGIITFTPGNADKETTHRCPDVVDDLINATGAKDCKVVNGSMRIIAHVTDDVEYAIASLRDGLEQVMTLGLGQNGDINGITFLSYLGDSEDDVLALITGGRTGDVIGDNSNGSDTGNVARDGSDGIGTNGTNTTDGGMVANGIESTASEPDDDDKGIVLLFALGLPLLVALILLAALRKNKRTIVVATPYRGLHDDKPEYVIPGTGDPPGAFHEGLFHYMKDGTSYLSTNCRACYETRRDLHYIYEIDGIDSDDRTRDLATILENEPYDKSSLDSYEESVLQRADPDRNLNQNHMGIDVHKCSSATCKICTPFGVKQFPTFLSRNKSAKGGQIQFTDRAYADECAEV